MSVFAMRTTAAGGDYEVPPAGNFPAVLVALVDCGTQTSKFGTARKVFLVWQIDGEADPAEEGSEGEAKRFYLGEQYTASLNEKANLRKVVNMMRGKPLGEEEEYDVTELVGKPCMVDVQHTQNGDRKYAKVGSVARLPKGVPPPKPEHKPFTWEVGDDLKALDAAWLPRVFGRKLRDEVMASAELSAGKGDITDGGAADGADEATF